MSQKFPGGFITKSPVAPTTTAASGIWTLDQQEQYQQAGTWPSPPPPPYIEDVFSTQVYTGTGATNNIVNGIDLASKGGLVWTKARSTTSAFTFAHALIDTLRGVGVQICSDRTDANTTQANSLTAFNSNGYTLGADTGQGRVNNSSYGTQTYVSWTFRKQPKFFDVVTYTGNGGTNNIAHNLQSIPGCIIIKSTSTTGDWAVICRDSYGSMYYQYFSKNTNGLNSTGAATGPYDSTAAINATTFDAGQLQDTGGSTNQSGVSYVAYLFAHNAGGFGATETENVISCGSWSTTLVGGRYDAIIDLGWEPQWVLFKPTNNTGSWQVYDNMRGWTANTAGNNVSQRLYPNLNNAEDTDTNTQLQYDGIGKIRLAVGASGYSGIYIAIRRGPMKTPTTGTSVFSPSVYNTAPSSPLTVTTNFPVDLSISTDIQGGQGQVAVDRLRGVAASSLKFLQPNTTAAEASSTGMSVQSNTALIDSGFWAGYSYKPVYWNFRRAPSFFDEVCYTGTGSATTFSHNLGAVPEMMIVKWRTGDAGEYWYVYHASLGVNNCIFLNTANAASSFSITNGVAPTNSVFTIAGGGRNKSGATYVNYLFATCAGVSKVGSYTGTGSAQTINCGFTSGARFLLIKRTDLTGDWYTYDSARGITSGNDPYLFMNSTAAQVSGTNYVDSDTTGFTLTSSAPAALNSSGGTYIFLAIA